jgi:hypothetical protein
MDKKSDEAKASQQELPLHQVASEPDGKPKPAAQRNFTDPDSRIMVKDGAYIQDYNAQIVVDAASRVIIAQGVVNQPPDQQSNLELLGEVSLFLCLKMPPPGLYLVIVS